ncbi:SIS domain-containing protein [Candidatus Pelagibacter sp.]|nr:SIS domain-containing protein [Candidatus Pelagibacter sp.]
MINLNKFTEDYVNLLSRSILSSNLKNLQKSSMEILKRIKNKKTIYVCGNGGSAAIANHYVVDFLKFFKDKTKFKPRILSLSNNIESITAISNDINYKDIFSYQLDNYYRKGDLLIVISSSGNSQNIVKLVNFAKQKKIKTIGFSGFKGGYLQKNCNISVHIDAKNYGISEDAHHILMHVQLQYLIYYLTKKKLF